MEEGGEADPDPDVDLDELLDEVESKFCRSVSTRSPVPTEGSDGAGHPRRADGKASDTDDLDSLLREFLDEDDASHPQTEQLPEGARTQSKTLSQSEGRRCCPVFLGGSSSTRGVGTAVSQRSCDQLRCTSCDFRVLTFDDVEWDSSCDYLFLRNNMPDAEKLRARLKRSRGKRAYACQCSWFSARGPADLRQLPRLGWVCGRHPL